MSKICTRAVRSLGAAAILGQCLAIGAAGAQTGASAVVLKRDSMTQSAGTIAEIDVLANDQIPADMGAGAIEIISQPQCGSVTAHPQRVTYETTAECEGPQIFYYGIAGSAAFAEVTVVVQAATAAAAPQAQPGPEPTVTFGLARIERTPPGGVGEGEIQSSQGSGILVLPAPSKPEIASIAPAAPALDLSPRDEAQPAAVAQTGDAASCAPEIATRSLQAALAEVSVIAPCQANTVAELRYGGLGLAIALDAEGAGTLLVPGFESHMPATLAFADGSSQKTELRFFELTQIDRMAVAWDATAAFELNALEFGAERGTKGHLDPANNPRSFDAVRRDGGGFLMTFAPVSGVGQHLQLYTHVDKPGAQSGIVRLVLDHERSGLVACGSASPSEIFVLVSNKGEVAKTVRHNPTTLGCAPSGVDQIKLGDLVGNVVIR